MADEKKLIYADDARREILREAPQFAYIIDRIKPADAVEVVHGRWIYEPVEFSLVKDIRCSVCRRYVQVPENYCPNCGAKMDGDGNG